MKKTLILNASVEFILSTERFEEPLIKFPSESLNPSKSFLKCFFIFTSCPYSFLYIFFNFYLFPGIFEFWRLATVIFKFTVLYNNIYKKKHAYQSKRSYYKQ